MDKRTKLVTARMLHSKLVELEPPRSVTRQLTAWLTELERDVRSGVLSDQVDVGDSAQVELITHEGPKQ